MSSFIHHHLALYTIGLVVVTGITAFVVGYAALAFAFMSSIRHW